MAINILITASLISSAISSLITFLLKQYFDKHLEYRFNKKLEEIKAELNIQTDINKRIIFHRFEIYPKFGELIYRLRNILRDICDQEDLAIDKCFEFMQRLNEYTDQIFNLRLDLEGDNIFNIIHNYKKESVIVRNMIMDLFSLIELPRDSSSSRKISRLRNILRQKYQILDKQYIRIIRRLTKLLI